MPVINGIGILLGIFKKEFSQKKIVWYIHYEYLW